MKNEARPWRALLLALVVPAFLLIAVPAPPAAAQIPILPGTGPQAGPVEVFTMAGAVSSPFGALVDTTFVVENSSPEPVKVFLAGRFSWPDGSFQAVRYGPPMTLPPNSALILQALSLVPDGVGSGPASFTGTAIVGSIGKGGRSAYPGRLVAQDTSSFVLP